MKEQNLFTPENIFESDTDVIVNPVNLEGVMGAGLAKQFREKFPLLEATYKEACKQRKFYAGVVGYRSPLGDGNEILISDGRAMFEGNLFLFGNEGTRPGSPRVLCFPTKKHWKNPSDIELIEKGLKTFVNNYKKLNIKSITFPRLGCGLGGLDWKVVSSLMHKYLDDLPIDVRICGEELAHKKDCNAKDILNTVIQGLREVEVFGEYQQKALNTVIDALKAYGEGPEVYNSFVVQRSNTDMSLKDASLKLWDLPKDQSARASVAIQYAKDIVVYEKYPHVLECSVRGDKRFSAVFAKVSINGEEKSIDEWYQSAKRSEDGGKVEKGCPFDHIVDPFTNTKLSIKDAHDLYRGLWIKYLKDNPDLVEFASKFDEFTDSFYDPDIRERYRKIYYADPSDTVAKFFSYHTEYMPGAAIIAAYVKGNRQFYVDSVKASHWYKNMVAHKKSLSSQIDKAESLKQNQPYNGYSKSRSQNER